MADRSSGRTRRPKQILGRPERPALPGQDPGRVETIFELLVQELQPSDIVEELWLADIACLTARIEFFRASLRGYYAKLQRDKLAPSPFGDLASMYSKPDPFDDEREDLRRLQGAEFQPAPGHTHLDNAAYTRLLGEVIATNLGPIGRLDDIEQKLLRERDRLIAQFERRRRNAVKDAVDGIDRQPPALPSPSSD